VLRFWDFFPKPSNLLYISQMLNLITPVTLHAGGACGYEDVVKEGYGEDTAAVSIAMFKEGQTCGACYEVKCADTGGACKKGKSSISVTATNLCPDGGWCSPPKEHFDLAKTAFLKIAEEKAGVIPVNYRRIPCKKKGGIRFTITGNPHFNLISVSNVGGAGDVIEVEVRGDKKTKNWTTMKRNWGQKWQTDVMLVGETLSFRVRTSDRRHCIAHKVVPNTWQFGQTFEGKNF